MANDPDPPTPGLSELARIVAPHLLAFGFPLYALAFLSSAPHEGAGALYFMLLPAAHGLADRFSPKLRRQPVPRIPAWPFDVILFALAAFQLLNMVLLARLFATQHFWTLDGLVAILLVGATSGYSAIVVAHELIHRRARWQQQLGRLLLCTTMYEHFYTEHLRGHHLRVATSADPATARYGERFLTFYLRTVPAQFVSAWQIEARRLGCDDARPWDPRLWRSRVVHGLVVEWGIAFVILSICGLGAFAIFLLQALFASRALEVVNYFEHWGLARSGPRISTLDSWDTDSWVTYYSLTGLSRHSDHHAFGARPYQELRVHEETPRLPHGYLALFPLALVLNTRFQRLMTAELERRRLGPFAPAAERAG